MAAMLSKAHSTLLVRTLPVRETGAAFSTSLLPTEARQCAQCRSSRLSVLRPFPEVLPCPSPWAGSMRFPTWLHRSGATVHCGQ